MLILIIYVINYGKFLSKPNMEENDYTMSKIILDELLRTKSIPRKEYNGICKNLGLI